MKYINIFTFCILAFFMSMSTYSQVVGPSPEEPQTTEPIIDSKLKIIWSAPTSKQNGDELTLEEIQGYILLVSYPDGVSEEIPLTGALTTEYTMPIEHGAGPYLFRAVTVSNYGQNSDPSGIASIIAEGTSKPMSPEPVVIMVCEDGSICNYYQANPGS